MIKKINTDGIDESYVMLCYVMLCYVMSCHVMSCHLISSIKKDSSSVPENPERLMRPLPAKTAEHPEPPAQQPEPETLVPSEPLKDENRNRRNGGQEYETLFIREIDLPPVRFGKSVYIRKEYHDRISQIISAIGRNEVSLFGYIDNVRASVKAI